MTHKMNMTNELWDRCFDDPWIDWFESGKQLVSFWDGYIDQIKKKHNITLTVDDPTSNILEIVFTFEDEDSMLMFMLII